MSSHQPLAVLILALLQATASAAIYSESFDTDPGYVTAKGPNDNNISYVSFGAPGSGAPYLVPGQFAGTSQYLTDTPILSSTKNGTLSLGSAAPVHGRSRNRSTLTIIDTAALKVGQYNVSFDVTDFQSADRDTALYFHLIEGAGTTDGHVDFKLTSQTELPDLAPTVPTITTGKGATAWHVSVENEIKANGKFSLNFGLTEVGDPGNYLALVWSQVKSKGSAPVPSMTIDNIELTKLPSPTQPNTPDPIAPTPLGQSGPWTLLPEFSDEFTASSIDPQKWNNNPAPWGAWTWDENNTSQQDGKLKIQMVHQPHQRNRTNLFYKSGILRSHQQMTYGYYEARLKGCSLFPGACPSFWTYSNGRQLSGEVRYCEVDFVELQMNELDHQTGQRHPVNFIDMNLHLRLADKDGNVEWFRPNSHPELCANLWQAPWAPRDDFHVYGCHVTPETITWYVDGKKVAQKPNTYWHLPMNITLSLGLRHPHIGWVGQDIKPVPQAATPEGFPTSMEVDYVRVWQQD